MGLVVGEGEGDGGNEGEEGEEEQVEWEGSHSINELIMDNR